MGSCAGCTKPCQFVLRSGPEIVLSGWRWKVPNSTKLQKFKHYCPKRGSVNRIEEAKMGEESIYQILATLEEDDDKRRGCPRQGMRRA